MKKKRLLGMLMASTMAVGSMSAQTYMLVSNSDGTHEAFDINTIGKMLVAGNKFDVYLQQGAKSMDITKIKSIKFTDKTTAISPLTGRAGQDITMSKHGSMVSIKGWESGKTANVGIYGTNGQTIKVIRGWSGTDINLAGLAHGVYVMRVGNKTFKITL